MKKLSSPESIEMNYAVDCISGASAMPSLPSAILITLLIILIALNFCNSLPWPKKYCELTTWFCELLYDFLRLLTMTKIRPWFVKNHCYDL